MPINKGSMINTLYFFLSSLTLLFALLCCGSLLPFAIIWSALPHFVRLRSVKYMLLLQSRLRLTSFAKASFCQSRLRCTSSRSISSRFVSLTLKKAKYLKLHSTPLRSVPLRSLLTSSLNSAPPHLACNNHINFLRSLRSLLQTLRLFLPRRAQKKQATLQAFFVLTAFVQNKAPSIISSASFGCASFRSFYALFVRSFHSALLHSVPQKPRLYALFFQCLPSCSEQ